MLQIVSATRASAEGVLKTPLGLSLHRMKDDPRIDAEFTVDNKEGLSSVYNKAINEDNGEKILVFMHDDVWLDDYHFAENIEEGLKNFDVIGLAGNADPKPLAPSWAFKNEKFEWDDRRNLSGAVAHGEAPFGPISWFGPSRRQVRLLDGLLLAARCSTLLRAGVRFDERFTFHFYDLDFCNTARAAGLRLGTWPVAVTHVSGGAFGGPSWQDGWKKYIEKWKQWP
jgi:GT2 family glycosyltransferase